MIRSIPSGVGGGATDRLRTRPATVAASPASTYTARTSGALPDHVVDRRIEGTQRVVVDLRQVEVHAPGAVGVDLGAGDERAGPALVDDRVEHVRVGVQLGDTRPVLGVDVHDDVTGELDRGVVEDVPHGIADDLDAGDGDHAAGMLERPGVAHLPTAARVERRAVEHDPAGRGVDDGRAVLVQIGLLVAQVDGHGLEPSDAGGVSPLCWERRPDELDGQRCRRGRLA